ncbi:MAG: 2OG-Fe(II) oxygenase [Marinobacter sp.]|uniref:2OG-Fe(II) oxygenase n=1 Tax=Marinobacter sp. TaxID=50741 RepID=UPI001B655444|nr:2OG-Fe(II) oxygenase [Marinobacter sp.]MBQ0746708.1 2OG-Fe(II) oxygenase [Marinobacter sp.]MBQ0816103.1 2OG-Fe(II) oxygenase [Marinobacter sp.]
MDKAKWLDEFAQGLYENGWISFDITPWLGPELLRALQQEIIVLDQSDALKIAGIGRGSALIQDRSVRRDKIAWLQGSTPSQAALFDFLDNLRTGLNQRLFLGLKRFEAHYATYHCGDFYKPHVDSFQGRASRIVSLVLYLNDDWQPTDGGALRIYSRGSESDAGGLVLPEAGRVALFMSEEIRHEVLEAHRTRYSLACWFRQDVIPLPLSALV